MKILIADKIAESGVQYLREQDGVEAVEAYGSSPEELKKLASDVDAIIVRSASPISARRRSRSSSVRIASIVESSFGFE